MKTTRRQWIGTGLAAPLILGARDKAGSHAPVLGDGAYKYEAIHDWGELPSNIKYGNTHGVVEDAQGHIYIHHTVYADSESPDTMVVFDSKGKFVRSWGKEFRGVAHGLWLRKEGQQEVLYLTVNAAKPGMQPQPEVSATVIKATLKGEIIWKIQGPPDIAVYKPAADGSPTPYNPTNLAIAPNGDVFVADGYGSYYINQYNSKGEYIRTFGGRGSSPGELKEPHGIWMDMRTGIPILTVADRRNARLQRFTLDGRHLDFVNGFRLPCHFHEHNGAVVIPDLQGRVTLIDKNNRIIEHLGDSNPASGTNPLRTQKTRENFTPGQFIQPHGACFDHAGNIFVVEWVEIGRVTKLRKVA
ncbi:MAG TPA: hypothetical protein VK604_15465 [Bryobacteraceae bacterium]|nr:hypothetical protein [Bryobacteraceae bacterium]